MNLKQLKRNSFLIIIYETSFIYFYIDNFIRMIIINKNLFREYIAGYLMDR